ncbi:MAG: insulinase family protein [Armatimonadetes bacterium]|nr:insulinase family protein [Armatimonadota bacterium]
MFLRRPPASPRRFSRSAPRAPLRLLSLLGGVALALLAAPPAPAQKLEDRVVEHTLKNGMKFFFLQRKEAPVFSGVINFRVGGVDEHVGITGLAHMFEHMAFKGTHVLGTRDLAKERAIMQRADEAAERLRRYLATPNPDPAQIAKLRAEITRIEGEARPFIVNDEFDEIYSRNGATGLNAFTARDITSYYVSLPSNRFELWALMESQRLATPVLREFYAERDVVAEERRLRTETQPDGKLDEAALATAFLAHPYGSPTIGWMSDILNLTRPAALKFRETYYAPNNAVAAVVGDIDPKVAIPIVEKYFGSIPAGPPPPPVLTKEPPQEGERRVEVRFDAQPQLTMLYHKPNAPAREDYVFDVIDGVLTGGRTSRLYRKLVQEKQIAASVGSYVSNPGSRYPNLFTIEALPRAPHTAEEVAQAIQEELDRLKTEPVTPEELQKVKNNAVAMSIYSLNSNTGLAQQLASDQIIIGDWRYSLRWSDVIQKITAEDVMRVAKQYLNRSNRTTGVIVPTEGQTASPLDTPTDVREGSPSGGDR